MKKLRPGEHTITVVVTDAEGVTTTGQAFLNVVRDGHDREHSWDDKHPDH